jgi:membrane-bound lytic murein transglycosylase A
LQNYLLIFLSFIILGCTNKTEQIKPNELLSNSTLKKEVKKTEFDYLNGFYDDDLDLALGVFKHACTKAIKKEMFKEVCENSRYYTNGEEFFTKYFTPRGRVSHSAD